MLADFLYNIDASTMVLGTFFAIMFGVLMFALNRTIFKENRGLSTIIAFCVALLATWGINRSNYNLSGLFTSVGIPENLLYIITPILLLIILIFGSIKKDKTTQRKSFSFARFIELLGFMMILLGMSPIIYQKAFYIIGGAVLLALGLYFGYRSKKKDRLNPNYNQKRQNIDPRMLKQNIKPQGPSKEQLRQQGMNALINAARNFKGWALKQPNPKFVGSWAMFINYLKRGNWGRNENEICQRLNINRNDFVKIFNRYGKV